MVARGTIIARAELYVAMTGGASVPRDIQVRLLMRNASKLVVRTFINLAITFMVYLQLECLKNKPIFISYERLDRHVR